MARTKGRSRRDRRRHPRPDMKDNPRTHKAVVTYREGLRIKKMDVWSYQIGTMREFHVAFLTETGTVVQGKFRIRGRARRDKG